MITNKNNNNFCTKNPKILITGATGFVGKHLIPHLVHIYEDIEILTINRSIEKAQNLFSDLKCKHILSTDYDSIIKFNPDVVIHLATLSTSRNDMEIIKPMLEANIEFGVQLLSVLSKCNNLKLFVNVGSFAEYRSGTDKINDAYLYTATKSAFRHFVDFYSNLASFKYITAVPYTIYGGNDTAKKIIDYIRESLISQAPVKMTKGEQTLDFIHISDVVSFFAKIIENLQNIIEKFPNGEEFHLGTGVGTKIRELARLIEQHENKKCNIDWGGLAYRPMDVMYAVAPIEKNNKVIKWKSKISIEEGLKL
ncbi:MAG: NAD(P)-dependent oxidoreductase [Prevotellaceae bacterium]|jgi:CDP-paratose synthetase|nr:NAD(P)-dependent oxidoreductase [Prevotellaceae bacterium]